MLAIGSGGLGVVGDSGIARTALLVFGIGPLAFLLLPTPLPLPPVVVGMCLLTVVTVATVVTAVSVVRAGVLHGIARWSLMAVAADALLTAAMSSVQLGPLPLLYLEWQLGVIRPVALLVWGLALVHRRYGPAIRRRVVTLADAWRRSTDVGGAAAGQDRPEQSWTEQGRTER